MANSSSGNSTSELLGMEFVTVGDPGNTAAPADSTGLRQGSVEYIYRIGKYEVTYGQYIEFLNAKAKSDPTGLYDPSMTNDKIANGIRRNGSSGSYTYSLLDGASASLPVSFVNFTDAARFANWMNNGKGDSGTEDGAYRITTAGLKSAVRLDGINTYMARGKPKLEVGDQVTISGFQGIGFDVRSQIDSIRVKNGKTLFTIENDYPNAVATGRGRVVAISATRSPDASFWIPNEDEWLKAAYYNPHLNEGAGGYYKWATQSNDYPGNTVGSLLNQANIPSVDSSSFANTPLNPNISPLTGPNLLTPVGAFSNSASYYGTFDQDGNVTEWTETVYDSSALFGNWNRSANSTRSKHGAMYYSGTPGSSRRDDGLMPNDIGYATGFRLAASAGISQSSTMHSNALTTSGGDTHLISRSISLGSQKSDHHHHKRSQGSAIFGGPISASQEIWPTVYPASGYARVVLNSERTELRYKFRITGLDFGEIAGLGPVTDETGDDVNGMHIHHAPAGAVGDPVLGIINPNQDADTKYNYNPKTKYWTIKGRWTKEDPSVVSFKDNLKNYLFQGLDYINIHNEDVALGVIRGQFSPLNDVARANSASLLDDDSSDSHVQDIHRDREASPSACCDHGSSPAHQSHRCADSLIGKNGKDVFCFNPLDLSRKIGKSDQIINFDSAQDIVDLQQIDADLNRRGDQSFTFVGTEGFVPGQSGVLRYSSGMLMADLDGDAKADFSILIKGEPALTSANLIL